MNIQRDDQLAGVIAFVAADVDQNRTVGYFYGALEIVVATSFLYEWTVLGIPVLENAKIIWSWEGMLTKERKTGSEKASSLRIEVIKNAFSISDDRKIFRTPPKMLFSSREAG